MRGTATHHMQPRDGSDAWYTHPGETPRVIFRRVPSDTDAASTP